MNPLRSVSRSALASLENLFLLILSILVADIVRPLAAEGGSTISFSRQIQPILAEHCLPCHGPDDKRRKSGLRLDDETSARERGKSGERAIIPGSPETSGMMKRLRSKDPDEVMPPPRQGKRPSPQEMALLERWILQGASWGRHWSFEPPVRPRVPDVATHPIDAFIRDRLKVERLPPSPEADRRTLVRRLYLDLTGLPPSPHEVENFVRDPDPSAYERLLDRLLASPHFGERWGRHWLDLARYADSDGYEKDTPRPTAFYFRDWVIRAINEDMPFDRFTVEQLAGDLLDEAGESHRIATGFHRQTLTNKEGGVDQEEFRCKANVDRTHTTAAVWLGLTMGCAECHSHKYDPISQREFYQFYAFFNNASEAGLPLPTPADHAAHEASHKKWSTRLDELVGKLASADRRDKTAVEKLEKELENHKKSEPAIKPPAALVITSETRETRIHVRGDFLQKGDRVEPGTPGVLPALSKRHATADRLDLALWLTSPDNPLTARVAVNHIWRQLFGRAIVPTENDFGLRGDPPSHPELLDWLATEYVRLGWSRKAMIRLITASATYKQSSAMRSDLLERDPQNILLARQARFRVEAEVVRDIALASSGILNERIGGPSFKPVLPPDLAALSYASGLKWEASEENERLRRGLYIHYQRTVPFPMLTLFDAPESTTTCTRRERSSTPMQALTLLNNEVFTQCARQFGLELFHFNGGVSEKLKHGLQRVTGRMPSRMELDRLLAFHSGQRQLFSKNPEAAALLASPALACGQEDLLESATWVAVARILLNLDEVITRE